MAEIELSRRGFLKAIGVTSAGIVLPSFDILMPKVEVEPKFRMRPIIQFDIERDLEILRYDVFDGKTRLFIAASVDREIVNDKQRFIKKIHKPMVTAMKKELFHRRIPPSRLKTMDLPAGYRHPGWFQEILYG